MINLTDEQKAVFAERIQTPANNAMITSALRIRKFQPKAPVLSDTEVSKVTSTGFDTVYVALCENLDSTKSVVTVGWIQNGTVWLTSTRNELMPEDFAWTIRDTGITADAFAISYDGPARKNEYGEPVFVSDGVPYIVTISNGVLSVHHGSTETVIDTYVNCADICRIYGSNFTEYDRGLVLAYVKIGRLYYTFLDGDSWSESILTSVSVTGTNVIKLGRTIDGKLAFSYRIPNSGTQYTVRRGTTVFDTLDGNSIRKLFDHVSGVSSGAGDPYICGVLEYTESTRKSDVQEWAESGGDGEWTASNYGELYEPYVYAGPVILIPASKQLRCLKGTTSDYMADNCNAAHVVDVSGVFYAAVSTSEGVFLYRQFRDRNVSAYLKSWDVAFSSDNSVVELNLELDNVKYDWFESDASVFNPGAQLVLYAVPGNTDTIRLCTAYVDEVKFSKYSDVVSISARDATGFFLKDSKLDYASHSASDTYYNHLNYILSQASVNDPLPSKALPPMPIYTFKDANTSANKKTLEIGGTASFYELIDKTNKLYDDTYKEYGIWSRADGSILMGLATKFKHFFPRAYVDINEDDMFDASCAKNADSAYSVMNVYGDSSATIKKAIAHVTTYKGWYIPPHKECHISIDEKLSSAKRTYYQDTYVKRLYNAGKSYSYKFSFNPAITPKDVARKIDGENRKILGVITEVKHTFSIDEGYRTEITIDSGGDVEVTEGATAMAMSFGSPATEVIPIDAEVNTLDMYGASRNQSILDLVQMNIGRAIK